MKKSLIFFILTVLTFKFIEAKSALQKNDKAAFYHAIATDNKETVNDELVALQAATGNEKEAYEGALLMKKAGMEALPKNKLHYFKAGRIKLETAIQAEPDNAEYRFLRLIIEEHAPKIVKYKANIDADVQAVKKGYASFASVVKHAVTDYSKTSKVLHSQDF